jgi:hypothetical protein
MSAIAYKVQVKLGQAEFSAEGPEDTVKEQFASFLQAASAHAISQPHVLPPSSNGTNGHSNGNGHANGHAEQVVQPASSLLPGTWMQWAEANRANMLFDDRQGVISVRPLLKGETREADTLLLILFGFLALKEQYDVKASVLLVAARQSGLTSVKRIDSILDKYPEMVKRGGIKRGSWYRLTNPGVAHAERLARDNIC